MWYSVKLNLLSFDVYLLCIQWLCIVNTLYFMLDSLWFLVFVAVIFDKS